LICSQVGIAGSTSTGDYVVMAGQVGVRDHVHIGDRSVIGAMSGIISDVPADSCLLGVPATPEKVQWVQQAAIAKLPEMRRQMKALQRSVEEMQRRLGNEGQPAAA
jgi:UDP-3-O-[3-hydroxymyristoyl] glucosamine N-acyltransferase